jgi:hypothetical protein
MRYDGFVILKSDVQLSGEEGEVRLASNIHVCESLSNREKWKTLRQTNSN